MSNENAVDKSPYWGKKAKRILAPFESRNSMWKVVALHPYWRCAGALDDTVEEGSIKERYS